MGTIFLLFHLISNREVSYVVINMPRICHADLCQSNIDKCIQQCIIKRQGCVQLCNSLSHSGEPCPITNCKEIMKLKYPCSNLKKHVVCHLQYNKSWSNEEKHELKQFEKYGHLSPYIEKIRSFTRIKAPYTISVFRRISP